MFEKFTYDCYIESLNEIIKDHAQVSFVGDLPAKYIILRHDVDYDLDCAMKMALLERQNGIYATYFLLLSSDMYNVANSGIVPKLWEMGHRVGLHYDLTKNTDVFREAEALSIIGGSHVGDIACHNPSLTKKDKFRSGKWLNSAYADKFTKDTIYISDSCGHWRKGAWDTVPDKIQLNIHPINWGFNDVDRFIKFENVRQKKLKEINNYMDYCKNLWAEHDKESL